MRGAMTRTTGIGSSQITNGSKIIHPNSEVDVLKVGQREIIAAEISLCLRKILNSQTKYSAEGSNAGCRN